MEGMAVRIHETRHHHATNDDVPVTGRDTDLDGTDRRSVDGDANVFVG
jgi:hypothetical protein